MSAESRLPTISPTLLAAVEFDKTYFEVPVVESGEKMVDLKAQFTKAKIKVVFNDQKTVTGMDHIFFVRESLVAPLLAAAAELAKHGFYPRFEYAYRRLSEQQLMYEKSVKNFIEQFPGLTKELILQLAGIFVACSPATAAHVSGAAVDITLLDADGQPIDLGVPYLHSGPESATLSTEISAAAVENRQRLLSAMEAQGFTNYPFEYWHFSMGDKIAAKIRNQSAAVYGPIIFTPETELMETVPNPDRSFEVDQLFE